MVVTVPSGTEGGGGLSVVNAVHQSHRIGLHSNLASDAITVLICSCSPTNTNTLYCRNNSAAAATRVALAQ